MAEIHFSPQAAANLKGRVVVLTGGAQGIGGAAVALYHSFGAHVYFGDWDDVQGRQLEQQLLHSSNKATGGTVHFQKLDVRDYQSQLQLFDVPYKEHGHIDVAVTCAAVKEDGGWFEPESLDLETVKKEPIPLKTHIDINMVSVLSFCRIALAYMKASNNNNNNSSNNDDDAASSSSSFPRSICLVSSIAGITEAPGLFAYSTAKHGLIGLMRALRPWAPARYGVRVNAICPWATDTQLLGGVRDMWVRERMPMNTPTDVGRLIVQCSADKDLNGTAVFVTGGRFFDTEAGVARTMPLWMGERNAEEFLKGQELLGLGMHWTDDAGTDSKGSSRI